MTDDRRNAPPSAEHEIDAIAVTFVDLAGIARMKCVPQAGEASLTASGIGMSILWSASQGNDEFAKPLGLAGPTGDMRLVGVADARRVVSTAPGWAWMPVDQRQQDGSVWEACPRQFATRMVTALGDLGLGLRVGYELEWALIPAGHATAASPVDVSPSFGSARFGGLHAYFRALMAAADAAGVGVEQMHPEHGQGQVEASLRARDPIFACDDTVIFRLLASTLAERDGFRASFSPKPFLSEVGNGHHLHFSVWSAHDNLFAAGSGSNRLHPTGEAFLAGVLEHLPALTGLGASSPVSYVRLRPSQWAGAFACWGVENREAGLRLEGTATGNPVSANVEWKAVDPTANPYLAVGGMIAAGIDGVRRELALPKPFAGDPASLSEAERRELGVRPLPRSLQEAGEAFGQSAVLREAMGPFLHACVEAVRLGEARAAAGLSDAELIDLYRFTY